MAKKFEVLIPLKDDWKSATFLVDSLRSQSHPDYVLQEIYLVDDGSSEQPPV